MMQTAALALEASSASQMQCVRAELHQFWQRAAEISGKVWALLSGPAADSSARRLARIAQPLQAPDSREMDPDAQQELDMLLLELVLALAAVEEVTAAAESLLRRLPGNRALVASMMERLLRGSAELHAVRSHFMFALCDLCPLFAL